MCCLLTIIGAGDPPQPGKVLDEARQAGRSAASLPAPLEDYFHDMDGGADLKPDFATKLNPSSAAIPGWCGPAATTGSGTR